MLKRFLPSWGLSVLAMMVLSWTVHGIILNDFNLITVRPPGFWWWFGVVYLGLGALQAFAFGSLVRKVKRYRLVLALGVGTLTGLIGFVVIHLLLGMYPFSGDADYLMADAIWQIVEQSAGALSCWYMIAQPLGVRVSVVQ